MALDGIFLRCLAAELARDLTGARVDKIHQPAREELVLHLRSREGARRLFLCANAARPRVNLLRQAAPENPAQPSMFCMLLRKHLTGCALRAVRQEGMDRILFFDFAGTNEIGEPAALSLCAEFTGRRSNLILLKQMENEPFGVILDACKRVDSDQNPARPVLPGFSYELPPPQSKLRPDRLDGRSCLAALLENHGRQALSEALWQGLDGVSPLVGRELTFRCAPADPELAALSEFQRDLLAQELDRLGTAAREGHGKPILLRNGEGTPADFSYMELTQCGGTHIREEAADFSALLETFYAEKDRAERTRQRTAELLRQLATKAARTAKRLEVQRQELAATEDRERLRICAELILANRARLEADPAVRGAAAYVLENYYDGGAPLRIPADPALGPAANAQRYYKDYRRAKTAGQLLGGRIAQGEEELMYLESVTDLLHRTESQAEVEELRAELAEQGILRKRTAARGQKRAKALPPLEYRSTDGFRILVGRSNRQNDQLSLKIAKGGDLWFHTQNIPGSHVILAAEGREPTPRAMEEAAVLAAWHSKARGGSGVPVDYTPARLLKKPPGAPPGKVIYPHNQTMTVTPRQEWVDRLGAGQG
ncbi:MAG: NFACT family protein [Oscillospiraceae bacterium]|jgi:predicted ribosome quality control (RQC) complex YloA/Tae2 family protein|nr:NFACT family protein [Oscillospiraceae bacterium]